MSAVSSRLRIALRTFTLVLLLLGVALNPAVAYMGGIHEADHATAVEEADTVGHHHVAAAIAEPGPADGDTDGWHGLMHADHAHGASSAMLSLPLIAVVPQNHAAVFPPTAPLTTLQHIAGPFRPPIV